MKILLLTDGVSPFAMGGMQKHSSILAKLISEQGHEVELLHCGGEGYSPKSFKQEFPNITEHIIPFNDHSKLPGHYLRATRKFAQQIGVYFKKHDEFDIIYAQGFTALYLKENGIKTPVFTNLHGFEMFQPHTGFKSKLDAKRLRKMARDCIGVSDFIYSFGGKIDELLTELKVPKEKIFHQMNGISKSWLAQEKSPIGKCKRFIFIGRQERRKGIEELNKALQIINAKDLNIEFHFVGPINEGSRLNLTWVKYHGKVKGEESIKSRLDEMDCLVCPSYSEGMPTVIAEAMARGCAIIATDVGAVSRQFNENGILLENPAVIKIAEAIEKMSQLSPEEFKSMSARSIEKATSSFIWEEIVKQKLADFESVLN